MAGRETAPIYFNSTIVLFLGGFMIALTMEKWNLHRRIALNIIHAVGGGPARIVLGFMIAAAFLSMWIANTATTLMMVPIGLAIILQIEDAAGKEASRHFSVGLMLGIAYGCTVGGLTTLVGTPPNLSFVRIFRDPLSGSAVDRLRAVARDGVPGRRDHAGGGVASHHPGIPPRAG